MLILYKTEFIWLIAGDKNRAEEGLELREEFLRESNIENDIEWFNMPCSLLEMFISFARRASFQTDIETHEWFWEFITNLHLEEYRRVSEFDSSIIENILNVFIWRTYEANGDGGMFPMRNPENNQREIEIWWQFCEYLDDRGLLYGLI